MIPPAQGQAHQGQGSEIPGARQDGLQALQGAVQQALLVKQVPAGVAGEAQLGEYRQGGAVLGGFPVLGQDGGGIGPGIGYPAGGRGRAKADKAELMHSKPFCL